MKYIKYILTFFIGMFYLGGVALAEESKFEPTINAVYENTDVNIILGYKGEIVNNLSHKIAFETKKFEFLGITNSEDFSVVKQDQSKSGKWTILDVKFNTSVYSEDSDYAVISLKANNYKGGDIFFYEYEASSYVDKYKYHHSGYLMKVFDVKGELTHVLDPITSKTKREYTFDSIKWYLLATIGIIFIAFVFILLKPSKRIKENKKDKLNTKIKYANNVIVGKEKRIKEAEEEKLKELQDEEDEILKDVKIVDNKVEGLARFNPLFDEEDK